MVLISFAVALNVLALSEIIFLGIPLLAENCFKHWTKVIVVMSSTSSRWIARVTQQVNKQIHTLSLLAPSLHLTYIGPAKSIAVYAKGGASMTWNEGSGGAGGAVNGLPSNRLQMTHLWMMERTRLLPPIIQYFARISVRVSFTPLCSTLRCALWAMSAVRMGFFDKITGCLDENDKLAWCNLPPHLHIRDSSWKRLNCTFYFGNFWSCSMLDCTSMIQCLSASDKSPCVSCGDFTLFPSNFTNLKT